MTATAFRLLVTGSRDWYDYDRVREEIGCVVTERMAETADPYPPVVHGAAKGADQLAAIRSITDDDRTDR